jgi:hypothetical protein
VVLAHVDQLCVLLAAQRLGLLRRDVPFPGHRAHTVPSAGSYPHRFPAAGS